MSPCSRCWWELVSDWQGGWTFCLHDLSAQGCLAIAQAIARRGSCQPKSLCFHSLWVFVRSKFTFGISRPRLLKAYVKEACRLGFEIIYLLELSVVSTRPGTCFELCRAFLLAFPLSFPYMRELSLGFSNLLGIHCVDITVQAVILLVTGIFNVSAI